MAQNILCNKLKMPQKEMSDKKKVINMDVSGDLSLFNRWKR